MHGSVSAMVVKCPGYYCAGSAVGIEKEQKAKNRHGWSNRFRFMTAWFGKGTPWQEKMRYDGDYIVPFSTIDVLNEYYLEQ